MQFKLQNIIQKVHRKSGKLFIAERMQHPDGDITYIHNKNLN